MCWCCCVLSLPWSLDLLFQKSLTYVFTGDIATSFSLDYYSRCPLRKLANLINHHWTNDSGRVSQSVFPNSMWTRSLTVFVNSSRMYVFFTRVRNHSSPCSTEGNLNKSQWWMEINEGLFFTKGPNLNIWLWWFFTRVYLFTFIYEILPLGGAVAHYTPSTLDLVRPI